MVDNMLLEVGPPEIHPYQKYITEQGHTEKIYQALRSDDVSEAVIATMHVLADTVNLDLETESKNEDISQQFRIDGNAFYKKKMFRAALECYNQALLYAPENSEAMKLAYSNRSALLFTIKAYSACINDIETFFSMGCTDYKISQRLKQRKQECLKKSCFDNVQAFGGKFAENFFRFEMKRNPQIPCASTDVGVVIDSGLPKIIAAKDIPVGRVVAVETPFVSELDQDNYKISCHYCHRLSFNLIPCDGCCVAMFCHEVCKNKCKKEYHDIECKITVDDKPMEGFANTMKLRAALKIKQMCKSWKELIAASFSIGEGRMRSSSVSDIYDSSSKFSLLSYSDQIHFVHGERFNQSFMCGLELHYLAKLDSFFPKDTDNRLAAIQAMARIMMHLYTSYRKIEIFNAARDTSTGELTSNTEHNYGWFSFAGKLRHSCNANLLILGIRNDVALIAIRPIEKAEELTVSFLGHYFENIPSNRPYRLFCFTQEICKCQVCVEDWSSKNLKKLKLTPQQKKVYKDWAKVIHSVIFVDRDERVFTSTCEGITSLKGAECTPEYHDMFKEFRKLTTLCQIVASDNQFLQNDDEELDLS